jgi:hypothetical protein
MGIFFVGPNFGDCMSEKHIEVRLQPDYITRITKVKKPILAIAELVWNSLDADATEVKVVFDLNTLSGLEAIRIVDNGHGIEYDEGIESFKNLGGSKKVSCQKSRGGRLLHGKAGKGRFKAYALGTNVEWNTRYSIDDHIEGYKISGDSSNPMSFRVEDSVKSTISVTGTELIIGGLGNHPTLFKEEAISEFIEHFALYLRNYPKVKMWFNGESINPQNSISKITEYDQPDLVLSSGEVYPVHLTVIEWKKQTDRSMYLCNQDQFPLERTSPGIHAPRFLFTAYIRSKYFQVLSDNNALDLVEIDSDAQNVMENAKQQLRVHFREQEAKNAVSLVEQWKRDKVYPYEGPPKHIIEKVEREVFDVIALSVNDLVPNFRDSETKNKKFTLRLLKQALLESPIALQKILTEVLELGLEKQEEFAQLLEKTSLSAIINASKTITDRIDFITGLQILVYDYKRVLLERKQLHKILEDQTWIFGEQYHLTASDATLNSVLDIYKNIIGRESEDDRTVLRPEGTEGIIDLMLSRSLVHNEPDGVENLIVELKRPSVKIDSKAISQVTSYALAVANDERFKGNQTKWVFWALSNEIEESALPLTRPKDAPEGRIFSLQDPDITIWAKTWSQLMVQCRTRLKFFQEKLDYTASNDSAIEVLRNLHNRLLPEEIQKEEPVNQQ